MTPLESPGPKIVGVGANNAQLSFTGSSEFCPKIRCHGNGVQQGINLNEVVGKPGPENRKWGRYKQRATIFHAGRVIVNFVPKLVAMATGVGRGEI